jgi:hypothetical protein
LKKQIKENIDMMIEGRNTYIHSVSEYTDKNTIYLPISFKQIVTNVKEQLNIHAGSLSDVTPLECYGYLDKYYNELDRRLREELPTRFAAQPRQQRSAPAVAPASRSSGINSARRTVRLSPSQIAIAKKLNVPLEEYAKYVKE